MTTSRRRHTRRGKVFGWLEIVTLVTITGLVASTITLTLTKYIKGVEEAGSGAAVQATPITGTVIGSFYSNLKEETVWISGSEKAVACVKTALQAKDR